MGHVAVRKQARITGVVDRNKEGFKSVKLDMKDALLARGRTIQIKTECCDVFGRKC